MELIKIDVEMKNLVWRKIWKQEVLKIPLPKIKI
jgi:hypothetical protein